VFGALAYAQTATVEVGFAFTANGKAFEAGKYEVTMPDANTVAIRGAGGTAVMPIITQLGRHDMDKDFELVFDKLDGMYLLSEVWFPVKDGYLLLDTKKAHEHAVIGGSNPHK
jgi:predicted metal-dependent peptidase